LKNPTPIIIPGLGNSGATHWQSLWQKTLPNAIRVEQRDWENPTKDEWLLALEKTVQTSPGDCVLIAHSLGVALVAHWAMEFHSSKVHAALLVSPSDVDSPAHTPDSVRGFAPMPLMPLPFRSIVVASSNDPFVSLARAQQFARAWGADFIDIGPCGHINADSALGDWPQGMEILRRL
jgi:predicted alpha/beta hydrolase family esterase